MSVLGFDIRDYTDPNRILEQSLAPQPPLALQSSGNNYTPPPVPRQAPPVPKQAPVTVDNTTGQQVTAPPGINPAATQQPPAVPIPGTVGPSGVSISTPASISPVEGVTNQDRIHAMAMVLGAVGQNNFSNVLNAAQTGLMEKEIKSKEYNAKLAQLTQPQLSVENGQLNYSPPMWEIDDKGNYQARSADAIKKDLADFYGEDAGKEKLSGESRATHARYVNELYEKRVAPLEDAIDKSDMALSYANYYYGVDENGNAATKAQKTQADRALIKAVEKLWDANSAVLQGEFEAAESAQDVITQLKRASDPTTGEVLGQESRAAMLDLIYRATDEMGVKYNRGAEEVYTSANAAFSPYQGYEENMLFAMPQSTRWMQDGQFVGRQMAPGWEEMRETPWFRDNSGKPIPPPETVLTPEAEEILNGEIVTPSVLNPYGVGGA